MKTNWKKTLETLHVEEIRIAREKRTKELHIVEEKRVQESLITDEKLELGRVIELNLTREDGLIIERQYDTRRKYVVIIGVDGDRYLYASVLINHKSNNLTKELAETQYPISQKDYKLFLDSNSTIDCSTIFPIDRVRLKTDGKNLGLINSTDLANVLKTMTETELIEPKIKRKYGLI